MSKYLQKYFGRTSALSAGGQRFESRQLYNKDIKLLSKEDTSGFVVIAFFVND